MLQCALYGITRLWYWRSGDRLLGGLSIRGQPGLHGDSKEKEDFWLQHQCLFLLQLLLCVLSRALEMSLYSRPILYVQIHTPLPEPSTTTVILPSNTRTLHGEEHEYLYSMRKILPINSSCQLVRSGSYHQISSREVSMPPSDRQKKKGCLQVTRTWVFVCVCLVLLGTISLSWNKTKLTHIRKSVLSVKSVCSYRQECPPRLPVEGHVFVLMKYYFSGAKRIENQVQLKLPL